MSLREKLASKAGNIKVTDEDLRKASEMGPLPARTAPGQLMHMQAKVERQAAEIARLSVELEAARKTGGSADIPLDQLYEVPGRRRFMPPEKYAELRENLRHNKLVQPVVVQARIEGGFEIVSGHHRTDAARELGFNSIKCVLAEGSHEEANSGAFFANLMQSDLTDFEKYKGFRNLLNQQPGLTQAQVAERAGVSEATVSQILSFEALPPAVVTLLEERPNLLGMNAGYGLALATKDGRAERVVEAVRLLAANQLDQQQAVRFARQDPNRATSTPSKAVGFKIKAGKATWCDVRRSKNVMRLEFRSEAEAQRAQEAIRLHLDSLAKAAADEKEKPK